MVFETNIEEKWLDVKQYASKRCDIVAFNVLYECNEYFAFIKEYQESMISGEDLDKEYASGLSIFFRYTAKMKSFMEEKSFDSFYNDFIEDPSFYIAGKEVVWTITHENYIFLADDLPDFEYFRAKGFLLEIEQQRDIPPKVSFWKQLKKLF